MKRGEFSAPVRMVSEIYATRHSDTREAPVLLGSFASRIDYPGGIEAFAVVLWDSVSGATGPEETRWIAKVSKVSL